MAGTATNATFSSLLQTRDTDASMTSDEKAKEVQ